MKRAGFLVGCIVMLLLNCAVSGAEIWYIPGWLRCHAPEQDAMRDLRRLFPEAEVVYKDWDGNCGWRQSVAHADAQVDALAAELAGMPLERRRRLTVIGHSLGGRMAARVNARLAARGCAVHQLILMGAAIPYTDGDLAALGKATELPVLNFCNSRDVTLKVCYGLFGGEEAPALGLCGMADMPENYREIALPEDIVDDVKMDGGILDMDAVKRLSVHYARFYIAYMARLMKGQALKSREILVPQDHFNEKFPVVDGGVWWRTLDTCDGWQLQENKLTGYCRILDAAGIRQAWGKRPRMEKAFQKVRRQLQQAKADKLEKN